MPYGPAFDFDFVNGRWFGGDPTNFIATSNFRLSLGSGLQSTVANSDVYTLKGGLLSILSTFNFTVFVSGSGSSTVTGAAAYMLDFDNDNVNDVLYLLGTSPTIIRTFPGGSMTTPLGAGSLASTVKGIIATGAGSTSIAGNGGAVQNSARVFSAIPSPCLGSTASAGQQYNGFITRLTAWAQKLSDDKLSPLTAL